MSRTPDPVCPELSNQSLSPSAFEGSLLRCIVRRKGLLGLVVPLIVGGAGWGMKQMAETAAKEMIQKDQEVWKKVQIDAIATVKQKAAEMDQMAAQATLLKEQVLAKLAEHQAGKARIEALLLQADKIPDLLREADKMASELAKVEKLRGELATVKNIADLQGSVSKITENLVKDADFQKSLTSSVSAEIATVAARTSQLETETNDLLAQLDAHQAQMTRLSAHPLIGGVPYRVLHVEDNPRDDYISVHQASSLKRPVGRVYFDPKSERAQFFRLSTSTSHEADSDGKAEVPRCHVLFKGWLPDKSLKLTPADFREGEATMIELKADLPLEDQRLRDGPGYDQRWLAEFDGFNMPLFTTGNVQQGWVEVTFEGWMAVTNGRSSGDPKYKAYMGPALPPEAGPTLQTTRLEAGETSRRATLVR